mmetsp:Transcript_57078/g.105523  ORF Transcript_57078/g.105523 Transcript_57078/m.105523 type:complete len:119 (-) Transcript_57078:65-421(-)
MWRLTSGLFWMATLLCLANSVSVPGRIQQELGQVEQAVLDASLSFLHLGGNSSSASHARPTAASNSSSALSLISPLMQGVTCQDKVLYIAAAGAAAGAIVSLVVCAEWRKHPPESQTL